MVKLKRKKFKGSFIHATDYYSFSNSYETYAMNIRIKTRVHAISSPPKI